ncbi:probable 26S proteasome complex subunit sem1 isoform X1 [Nasonia vitripennis]|uniref:Uncharacterized protein n=1 Tax=Nasonia vitripennis TaxID=7425 RepID=A0A7M7R215_NASVI|nr:probable 26S proteasome complex subunit sem1 isoform X1 [Nasonia vitripennis]
MMNLKNFLPKISSMAWAFSDHSELKAAKYSILMPTFKAFFKIGQLKMRTMKISVYGKIIGTMMMWRMILINN